MAERSVEVLREISLTDVDAERLGEIVRRELRDRLLRELGSSAERQVRRSSSLRAEAGRHASLPDLRREAAEAPPPSPATAGRQPHKSSLSARHLRESRAAGGARSRSVRFDPTQVREASPPEGDDAPNTSTDSSSSPAGGARRRHGTFPRSRPAPAHPRARDVFTAPSPAAEDDRHSSCSTCSSSSSEDDFPYELPPRRAYGGVRISYVPNDSLAYARQRQAGAGGRRRHREDKEKCIVS